MGAESASHIAFLLVVALGAVDAGRTVGRKMEARIHESDHNSTDGQPKKVGGGFCELKETEEALGYGIKGLYPVSGCIKCKWNVFLHTYMLEKVIADPELQENGFQCTCNYSPRYWEGVDVSKKHWFEFRVGGKGALKRECSKQDCYRVWFQWGNMFNKKYHYPGDNERMPVPKQLEGQDNYDLQCSREAMPEGIVLPSPGDKISWLRVQIAKAEDGSQRKKDLEKLLEELTANEKTVEIFSYDMESEDWGPPHHADASEGDMHTYFLRPCKSNMGDVVDRDDPNKIQEICGPATIEEDTMKGGALRWRYHPEMDWGPEQVCDPAAVGADKCEMLKDEVAKSGYELLSFRLKPCMTPSQAETKPDLSEILMEEHCGAPSLDSPATLLPVKVSVSKKFDASAPSDELEFPCP